jgi:ABC-type transport system substrate-binding protein
MKSVRWFSRSVVLITAGLFLAACSPPDTNSSAPGSTPPVPVASSSTATPTTATPTTATPEPQGPPAKLSAQYPGAVDRKDCEEIGGWVANAKAPDAETKVALYIDDKLVETLPAATLRQDLTSWGSGLHGFAFKIPAANKDGKPHGIKVKVVGPDFVLPFHLKTPSFTCPAP